LRLRRIAGAAALTLALSAAACGGYMLAAGNRALIEHAYQKIITEMSVYLDQLALF